MLFRCGLPLDPGIYRKPSWSCDKQVGCTWVVSVQLQNFVQADVLPLPLDSGPGELARARTSHQPDFARPDHSQTAALPGVKWQSSRSWESAAPAPGNSRRSSERFPRMLRKSKACIGHAGPKGHVRNGAHAHLLKIAALPRSQLPCLSSLRRTVLVRIGDANPKEDVRPVGKQVFGFTKVFRRRKNCLEEMPRAGWIFGEESPLSQE